MWWWYQRHWWSLTWEGICAAVECLVRSSRRSGGHGKRSNLNSVRKSARRDGWTCRVVIDPSTPRWRQIPVPGYRIHLVLIRPATGRVDRRGSRGQGGEVAVDGGFEILSIPAPIQMVAIHGIGDDMVAGAPDFN